MSFAPPIPCDLERDPAYGRLKQHIIDVTGLAYYLDKDVELAAQFGAGWPSWKSSTAAPTWID